MICRRRALLALAALGVANAVVGCMHAPPAERFAYLKVVAEPPGTTIYENDHFLGTARILGKQGKALRPGVKYLTFKAPGYFPHDLRLDLPAGETVVQIKLRPIPP